MTEEARPAAKPKHPGFIPWLKDKKVVIRLIGGGQPLPGVITAYNPYEIILQTNKGQILIFKHAIATIEIVDEPQGYKPDV